jgi:anti-sigma factor RsiW
VTCSEALRTQAYFDAELDALAAAEVEGHLESCVDCRALLQDLERTRIAIRRDFAHAAVPPTLTARIARSLEKEPDAGFRPRRRAEESLWRLHSFWTGTFLGGAGVLAVAAALALLAWMPLLHNSLLDSLLTEHVDSLVPGHLISVESTDRHTVKPWFAGHADVSPPVEDFSAQGFVLVGGRADYLANQRAAVVVYQHGRHIVNVFSWKSDSRFAPRDATRNGYHLAFWKGGDLQFCAVSDTGWDDLHRLEKLFRDLGARESDPIH